MIVSKSKILPQNSSDLHDFCELGLHGNDIDDSTYIRTLHSDNESSKKDEIVELRLDEMDIEDSNPNASGSPTKFPKPKSKKHDNILRNFISTKVIKKKKSQVQSKSTPNQKSEIKRPGRPKKLNPPISTQANCSKKPGRQPSKQVKNSQKPPKKEYYRVKLLRGQKRIIRDILKSKIPLKTINRFKKDCKESKDAYEELKKFIIANEADLINISKTNAGPLTDGESYFRKEHGDDFKKKVNTPKTFNNGFCDNYFQNATVRESYELYVDYLYAGHSAKELCSKFEFACCFKQNCACLHTKWDKLREYSKKKLIECPKGMQVFGESSQMDESYNNEDIDSSCDYSSN